MTGKTHQIIGLGVGLGTFLVFSEPTYNPATLAAVLVFSSIGSLLPDLDKATAEIWDNLPFGHTAGRIVDPFIDHRNFTHSILGVILAAIGLFFILKAFPEYWGINTSIVFFISMAAYLSHLVADAFTRQGIPIFFPIRWMIGFPPKPFDKFRILTSSWVENLIIFPMANIALLWIILKNWPVFKQVLFK